MSSTELPRDRGPMIRDNEYNKKGKGKAVPVL
jgi:hypothetical protein